MPHTGLSDTQETENGNHLEAWGSALGRFASHHAVAITFVVIVLGRHVFGNEDFFIGFSADQLSPSCNPG